MSEHIEGAVIEIMEKCRSGESQSVIIPNEIRINGTPVAAPADHPVVVHEISMNGGDLVQVTLTLFAKRVTIGAEQG